MPPERQGISFFIVSVVPFSPLICCFILFAFTLNCQKQDKFTFPVALVFFAVRFFRKFYDYASIFLKYLIMPSPFPVVIRFFAVQSQTNIRILAQLICQ